MIHCVCWSIENVSHRWPYATTGRWRHDISPEACELCTQLSNWYWFKRDGWKSERLPPALPHPTRGYCHCVIGLRTHRSSCISPMCICFTVNSNVTRHTRTGVSGDVIWGRPVSTEQWSVRCGVSSVRAGCRQAPARRRAARNLRSTVAACECVYKRNSKGFYAFMLLDGCLQPIVFCSALCCYCKFVWFVAKILLVRHSTCTTELYQSL